MFPYGGANDRPVRGEAPCRAAVTGIGALGLLAGFVIMYLTGLLAA